MTLNFTILSLLLFLLEAPLVFFSHIKMTYKGRWRIGFGFVATMKGAAMVGKHPKKKGNVCWYLSRTQAQMNLKP
jgi:hypothetical protein